MVGILMIALGVAMIPPILVADHDGTQDFFGLLASSLIALIIGFMLFITSRRAAKRTYIGHREGFLIVGVGWFSAGLIGALPFYLYPHLSPEGICQLADQLKQQSMAPPIGSDFCAFSTAAFESISGFTTTGATAITTGLWTEAGWVAGDKSLLPRGILLWRSLTQYLGGMGLIVLGVAVLPLLGIGGMQLFRAEVPGPQTDKLAPRIGETAKLLWRVYLLLSVTLFILLAVGGMDTFDAVCHTFTTMATGGFSTRAMSIGGFESAYLEWTIILFMFIGGTNFSLHFMALAGRPTIYKKDPEFWAYSSIILTAITLICWSLMSVTAELPFWDSLRTSAFQVISIITTTGFASTDYEQWHIAPVALMTLTGLMFIGGMAGSTSGGFKVVRHVLVVLTWTRELFLLSHPRAKRPIRLGNRVVPQEVIRGVAAFAGAYFTLLTLGTIFFCVDGQDLLTGFTCSASTLGNVGPGLGEIGPMDNFSGLSPASKWFASTYMVLGRLELFTLLILLSPSFWRR